LATAQNLHFGNGYLRRINIPLSVKHEHVYYLIFYFNEMVKKLQKSNEKSTISEQNAWLWTLDSAQSLTPLMQSVNSKARLLQDSIDGIVREAEAFVSYIYCMTTADREVDYFRVTENFSKTWSAIQTCTEEEIRSIESLIIFYNSSIIVMIRILNFVLSRVTLNLLLCEHFLSNNDSKGTTKSCVQYLSIYDC
jgi:hypothetical protein